MADVLTSGPPPGAGRPRRWAVVAGAVVPAGAATLLAVRSTPGTPDAAPTSSAPAPVPSPITVVPLPVPVGVPGVVSVAVGRRHAYALVAACDTGAVQACAYRLHRRAVDGATPGRCCRRGWRPARPSGSGRPCR